jgi:hypothetical protein
MLISKFCASLKSVREEQLSKYIQQIERYTKKAIIKIDRSTGSNFIRDTLADMVVSLPMDTKQIVALIEVQFKPSQYKYNILTFCLVHQFIY